MQHTCLRTLCAFLSQLCQSVWKDLVAFWRSIKNLWRTNCFAASVSVCFSATRYVSPAPRKQTSQVLQNIAFFIVGSSLWDRQIVIKVGASGCKLEHMYQRLKMFSFYQHSQSFCDVMLKKSESLESVQFVILEF